MSSIADKLPFWHFDNDLMVYSDGSLGAGFKLKGFDISCVTNGEINNFTRNIENLLISCSEGLRLQVFYKLSSNVDSLIDTHEALSKDTVEVYKSISDARLKYLRGNAKDKNYFIPEITFFVRNCPLKFKKQKLFEKDAQYKNLSLAYYNTFKARFSREVRQVESALKSAKLNPTRLRKNEWFNQVFEYLNPSRVEKIGNTNFQDSNDPLCPSFADQVTLTDLSIEREAICLGKQFYKVITLKTLPEGQSFAAMIDEFTKLPFHFWISQNIGILNQAKEISKLQLQRRVAHSMAAGSENVSDLESESKLAQIEDLLRELLEGSEKLLSMDFSVIVWAESKGELEEKADEILKAFRVMNQAEGLVETLPLFDAFINALPSSCTGFRHKKLKSSNIAHLMPLYSCWLGNKKPVCLLPNRENSLFAIDPFASELPNWNGLVFGGSGSGKSFTISQLMLMFYGQKVGNKQPRIIWIDNGASSERLLEVLDGEFIDLHLDSGICLNMFDLEPGDTKPSATKIKLILGVLELILKDDERKGLPKREKALLEEAIFKTYQSIKDRVPHLGDLRDILKKHNVAEMKCFAEVLFSWTGNTAYGRMLDGKSNVTLTKDLVTIEVKGLDNHSDLKDIFLLLLTSYIKDESARDIERPYMLIVDEAERLFKTDLAKQFVILCYRTMRKFNCGIYCLSQNYRDFMVDREIADALMPNTTSVYILRQKKIDWNDFQRAFDLTMHKLK